MNLFKRHWPPIMMAAIVAGVSFYLFHPGGDARKDPVMDRVEPGQGLKLRDIHYTHDDAEERMKWSLNAKEVSFSGDQNAMAFREFELRVEPEAQQWFEMKGRRGEYSRNTGDIQLWGNLEGRSRDGYRFRTERLHINEKTRQARTDEAVEISGPLFRVKGKGLFADLNEERVEILSDVTTTLKQEAWAQ